MSTSVGKAGVCHTPMSCLEKIKNAQLFFVSITNTTRLVEQPSCWESDHRHQLNLLSEGWQVTVESLGDNVVGERQVLVDVLCGPVRKETVQQTLVPTCTQDKKHSLPKHYKQNGLSITFYCQLSATRTVTFIKSLCHCQQMI